MQPPRDPCVAATMPATAGDDFVFDLADRRYVGDLTPFHDGGIDAVLHLTASTPGAVHKGLADGAGGGAQGGGEKAWQMGPSHPVMVLQPGMQQGMHPGMHPGMQVMQQGMHHVMQGMHPGVPQVMQQGMQGLQPGMRHPAVVMSAAGAQPQQFPQ